jgi:hypothetical protein
MHSMTEGASYTGLHARQSPSTLRAKSANGPPPGSGEDLRNADDGNPNT